MTLVAGLAGWSGAGKTTLIAKLIPALKKRGLSVSTLKHAHHAFDIGQPGKDSYIHREAGAHEVLVASAARWALLHEQRDSSEPRLDELLPKLSAAGLILVEGFRHHPFAKIEVYRAANSKPYLYPDDLDIGALVSDEQDPRAPLPWAHLDDTEAAADLILALALPLDETLARLTKGKL